MDLMVSFSGEGINCLLRQVRGESLNNISELFNIKAYSTVSSILRRVSRLKKSDRKIKKQVNEIQDSVTKGQK
jgi:chromosomal replication initiation ATPase DnaA